MLLLGYKGICSYTVRRNTYYRYLRPVQRCQLRSYMMVKDATYLHANMKDSKNRSIEEIAGKEIALVWTWCWRGKRRGLRWQMNGEYDGEGTKEKRKVARWCNKEIWTWKDWWKRRCLNWDNGSGWQETVTTNMKMIKAYKRNTGYVTGHIEYKPNTITY